MKGIISFFLFLLISISASKSQIVWTLERCIKYALENNIQIKQSDLQVQSAKLSLAESKYAFLPNFNSDASHSYNFGRSVDPFTNTYVTNKDIQSSTVSLNSSVTVFNGFQKKNQLLVNELEWKASLFDLEKAKNDISINITSAYLNIMYTLEQVSNAKNQLTASQLQYQQTQKLVQAGNLAEISLKDADAQIANEELNVVIAVNNRQLALLKLLQLLQLPTNNEIQIDTTWASSFKVELYPPTTDMIYDAARYNQPGLMAQQFRLSIANKNLDIRRGALLPTLSLFGSLRTNYSNVAYQYVAPQQFERISFNNQLSQNFGKAFGVSLNIPIFNGYQASTAFKKSALNVLNTKYTLDQVENQLKQEVAQAATNRNAAEAKYKASQKYFEANEQAYNANSKKFNAGVITAMELNTAKNSLSKAQSDLISAKYDFYFKSKIIDFYMGRPLY